jgi:phosphoglucosamine mutase
MSKGPLLFGTDGIRGVAGQYPLDRETVHRLGVALGVLLPKMAGSHPLEVVLGEDTRESSPWISRVFAAGLAATGARVHYAGVIPTPGVAFLARHHGFAAGVAVSASHNPYQDNGIKIMSSAGMKLSESAELKIEEALREVPPAASQRAEIALVPDPGLLEDYLRFLEGLVPADVDVTHYRLVVDAAHGAATRVIPGLTKRLGIKARILHARPNGRNINRGCGSLHPEIMARETKAAADLGVAFDGDADRAVFATHEGHIADGDHILFALAPSLKRRGLLKGNAVVGTWMTNLGLEVALAREGIGLKRAPVGDKHVLAEMVDCGINLGGEPSGHLIFLDHAPTGDGMITLLEVLRLLAETRQPLAELLRGLKLFPQVVRNIRVRRKPPLASIPEIAQAIDDFRRECGERGRAVIRYSGTEPLARVMVEAEETETVERYAARIAQTIEVALGKP